MKANGETNRGATVAATRGVASRLALSLVAALACGTSAAEDDKTGTVALWLSDAPLGRVLEQVAGKDGVRVVVGDDVDQRISGRLDGQRETVLATLAVEHGLNVHALGDTVWFDPKSRPVVALLRLSPEETASARAALEPLLENDSVVQTTEEGLVLSGSRAFVEDARRRVATLDAEPAATSAAAPDPIAETPLEGSGAAPRRELRSVWDIPGYDVDYTAESAS